MPRASVVRPARLEWGCPHGCGASSFCRLLRVQDARGGLAPTGLGGPGHPVVGFCVPNWPFSPSSNRVGGGGTSPIQTVTLHGRELVGGALNIWEDSSSLGLAHGTAQLAWLCPGVTRGLRGNPTMIAWAMLIEPLRTHWTARDFAPDNIFGLVAFIEHNAESMVDLAELWDVWRTWQSPRRGWRDPSMVPIPADLVAWRAPRARAVRSLWGWLGAMEAGEEPLPPCKACGLPTPELCERCFSSVCSTCPPTQCPGCHPVLRRDPSAAAAA